MHHIYENSVGFARLQKGGPAPYPDGTIFADDVRDVSLADGSYSQGSRKAIPVMLKDSKKYASPGGWGFQAWAGGDPTKPLVTDAVKSCFTCHTPQKANDYVFSTYLHYRQRSQSSACTHASARASSRPAAPFDAAAFS